MQAVGALEFGITKQIAMKANAVGHCDLILSVGGKHSFVTMCCVELSGTTHNTHIIIKITNTSLTDCRCNNMSV